MGGKGGGGGGMPQMPPTTNDPKELAQYYYNNDPEGKGNVPEMKGLGNTYKQQFRDTRGNYDTEAAWRAANGGAGSAWASELFKLYYPEPPAPAPAPAAAPAPAPAAPAPAAPAPDVPPPPTVSPPPNTPQLSTGTPIEQPTSLGNDLASTVDVWTGGTDDQGKSLKKSKTMTTTQT